MFLSRWALILVREHHAPVGALRRQSDSHNYGEDSEVREHHAPVGALRRW